MENEINPTSHTESLAKYEDIPIKVYTLKRWMTKNKNQSSPVTHVTNLNRHNNQQNRP